MVFEGGDAANPAAQLLRKQLAGAIAKFHAKARQQDELAGQDSSHMHQSLPGGGSMRYVQNGGQETIFVRVPTPPGTPAPAEERPTPPAQPIEPLLAIDILFTPEVFLAADVTSYTQQTIPPTPGPPWWDPSGWSTIYDAGDSFIGLYPGSGAPSFAWVLGPYQGSTGPGVMSGAIDAGDIISFDETDHAQTPLSPFVSYGAPHPLGTAGDWVSAKFYFIPAVLGSGGPTDVKTYTRDQYSFFDVLNVVGVVGDVTDPKGADGARYEATSLGASTDARLKPLTSGSQTIARTLAVSDPEHPGFTGAGFLARPRKSQGPTEEPEPVVFDVYLASINVTKENAYPDAEGATFEADDPSFNYDVFDELRFRIRAREFVLDRPHAVGVSTHTEKKIRHFDAGGYDTPPTIGGPDTVSTSDRAVDWGFAVARGWTDEGNEPADPTVVDDRGASTMGKLLADSGELTKVVTGPQPLGRSLPSAPVWPGDVTAMTKVATITWTPPKTQNDHGHADIAPA